MRESEGVGERYLGVVSSRGRRDRGMVREIGRFRGRESKRVTVRELVEREIFLG